MKPIFWMMTLGALGLVLGPWFQSNLFSVSGLILHLQARLPHSILAKTPLTMLLIMLQDQKT